jgi:hypothetical protein
MILPWSSGGILDSQIVGLSSNVTNGLTATPSDRARVAITFRADRICDLRIMVKDPATWERIPKVPSRFGEDAALASAGATNCPATPIAVAGGH